MKNWIIAIGNTAADGVTIKGFRGNDAQIKEKLYSLVLEDKDKDKENFVCGIESVHDVQKDTLSGHEYNAYATYNNYHIDYTAKELPDIHFLSSDNNANLDNAIKDLLTKNDENFKNINFYNDKGYAKGYAEGVHDGILDVYNLLGFRTDEDYYN